MVRLNPHLRQTHSIFMRNSSKISINYQIIMYNFQIETSFVNLNPLARNPGSQKGPIWNPVALPIWVPYRFLAGSVYMCFVVTCWERADLLALVCGV